MSLFCVYVQLRNEFMINVVRSLTSELCWALVNQVPRGIQSYNCQSNLKSDDFLRGFQCYSFCIVLCLDNELRENFFLNLSHKFVRLASSNKCHRIFPQMSHITKKLYSAKNTKVKMICLYFI